MIYHMLVLLTAKFLKRERLRMAWYCQKLPLKMFCREYWFKVMRWEDPEPPQTLSLWLCMERFPLNKS